MSRLLVPLLGDARDEVVLTGAAVLAKQGGVHVDVCLYVRDPVDVVPYVGEGITAAGVQRLVDEAEKNAEEREKETAERFDAWAAEAGIDTAGRSHGEGASAAYSSVRGHLPWALAAGARVADMCVLARAVDDDGPDRPGLIQTALFETGRPALLLPPEVPKRIARRVVVAWNGSAEAARAVAAAMPVLARAEHVVVITVDDGADERADPGQLAETLETNGIAATASAVAEGGDGVARTLTQEASKADADLLVIGAYSHSRLREMVLGGVTRDLLAEAPLAMLMTG